MINVESQAGQQARHTMMLLLMPSLRRYERAYQYDAVYAMPCHYSAAPLDI